MVETGETPENPSVNEQNPEEGEGSEAPSGDNETPVINDDNTGEEIEVNDGAKITPTGMKRKIPPRFPQSLGPARPS